MYSIKEPRGREEEDDTKKYLSVLCNTLSA
jgi:hypothetical protein